jgi:hypothetical protein
MPMTSASIGIGPGSAAEATAPGDPAGGQSGGS